LVKGATDTNNVLNHGMGYNLQRFSTLKQINKDTVKRLVPVWNYSFDDNRSEESQPLVYKGVLYVTTNSATMAIDAKTGKQIWKTKVEYPPETPRIVCCGIINRGAAIYDGKIFRTTLDANVIALDAQTGKELWRKNAIDFKTGYSMTVAPLVADGVVITGISGAEFGTRDFIDGWDPKTGEHLWRTYTVPGPGEPGNETWQGDTWKLGGVRPGSPARSIPSCTRSTGASAIRARSTPRCGRATISTPARCWRSIPRAARSSGTSSSRRTTRSTMTRWPKWCWPRSTSTASRRRC
jgi:alcohol dehydrogenase (cytochrome c)